MCSQASLRGPCLEDWRGEDSEREQEAIESLAEERGLSMAAARVLLDDLRADAALDAALAARGE
jgi:hypothetical protein